MSILLLLDVSDLPRGLKKKYTCMQPSEVDIFFLCFFIFRTAQQSCERPQQCPKVRKEEQVATITQKIDSG